MPLPTVALDSAEVRKARGAFFTPAALCDFLCDWAIRSPADQVLDPSCGDGAFLVAAARLTTARYGASRGPRLAGVELHAQSAADALAGVTAAGGAAEVAVGDFFARAAEPRYDAVLGNPPYIRYQGFSGDARVSARRAALAAGVGLTGLASSWAAFTVHAAQCVRAGGRLALVLPAELLTVNYAAAVRRFLMERFGRVRLVMFTERVFPGVLEEVVLLLAEDAFAPGGTDHCELHQVTNVEGLTGGLPGGSAQRWRPLDRADKWTAALLPPAARDLYAPLVAGDGFTGLLTWGETTLGSVTGRNNYFALSPGRARELGLREDETLPLSPPGSRHLRGLSLSVAAWRELGAIGRATLLFRPGADPTGISSGARRYLAEGREDGVDQAYKCRVRSPWWQVPLVAPADLLLTYMNADTPRLTTNSAGVRHLNSVHGVYLRDAHRELGRELLPLASLNSVTLLGAELVGRSYGGGMLKLEPREADELPVPAPEIVAAHRSELAAVRPAVRAALREGRLLSAVSHVDEILLGRHLRLSERQREELVAAHAALTARRIARGKRRTRPEAR